MKACGLLLVLGTCLALPAGAQIVSRSAVEAFPVAAVRLLPGSPFAAAQAANKTYLLALDPERLLAPFRREAGLPKRAESYGNWERTGLDGHTAGHYLSALATMIAQSGDAELAQRLQTMIAGLAECQAASADGYVGGIPGSAELWAEVRKGNVDFVGKRWVPWYNLHKLYAGLRDAWLVTGNEQARALLVRLADWSGEVTQPLSEAQMERMLRIEYGGMNDVLADVAAITGDARYLEQAKRFSHQAILEPLARGEDRLQNLHANTQVPKIIGFERIAALGGGDRYHEAAAFFWHTVTRNRSVAFGGNSSGEHFRTFKDMLAHREGPETCNTYNMLRLTHALFQHEPSARYADYYERALYNHILSSFNVKHPGYVYFTPILPGHYRVYSKPGDNFWCCVGTGLENPGRYPEFIYSRDPAGGGVFVNLFIPSTARWPERGLTLTQENTFPAAPRTRLKVGLTQPAAFPLAVRHPEWVAAGALRVSVNGEAQTVSAPPGSYVELRRTWRDGDVIEVELPMHLRVEPLPEREVADHAALLYGPLVLAAAVGTDRQEGMIADDGRMAHVASGPIMPESALPTIIVPQAEVVGRMKPVPGEALTFTLGAAVYPEAWSGVKLVPFSSLQDTRYVVYWKFSTPEALAAGRARVAAAEAARSAREAATLDRVAIGDQQSEVEHRLQAEASNTGQHLGRNWRDGHRFSYQLQGEAGVPAELAVTYFEGDRRAFVITVNGKKLADVTLAGGGEGFVERRYPLPAEVLAAAPGGLLTVEFSAAPGSLAGGLYGLALVKTGAPAVPADGEG